MSDKILAWRGGLFCLGLILVGTVTVNLAPGPAASRQPPGSSRVRAASQSAALSAPTKVRNLSLPPGKSVGRLSRAWKGRENNLTGEAREWARTDPETALTWAQAQPDGDDTRKEVLIDACFQIAQTNPLRAIMLAERFDLDREAVLTNLAQQWADRDLTSACQWIAAQADDDQRNALAAGLTLVWSKRDPVGAAQFVTQRMSPGLAQDSAVIMVLHQWAMVDLTGAAAWVQRFPASPLRDTALGELRNVSRRTP